MLVLENTPIYAIIFDVLLIVRTTRPDVSP